MILLNWFGRHAQWVLLVGVVAALFLPGLSAYLRPALPILVSGVIGVAIARLDLGLLVQELNSPVKVLQHLILVLWLMPATAFVFWIVSLALGPTHYLYFMLLILAAAPPIASTANLCFLLGFDAAKALVVTITSMLLTPLFGPLIFWLFWPEPLDLLPTEMLAKLAWIIAGGFAIGLFAKVVFGQAALVRNKQAVDGFAVINMVVFLLPLFDGVLAEIVARPVFAIGIFGFVCLVNLGSNLATIATLKAVVGMPVAGALGTAFANRTSAIYLAVLPFDPQLSVFVALYQFPMYATPLVLRKLRLPNQ